MRRHIVDIRTWKFGSADHVVTGYLSLTPPIHAFERMRPDLALDYRRRTSRPEPVPSLAMNPRARFRLEAV
jgi:hypothetical protein